MEMTGSTSWVQMVRNALGSLRTEKASPVKMLSLYDFPKPPPAPAHPGGPPVVRDFEAYSDKGRIINRYA